MSAFEEDQDGKRDVELRGRSASRVVFSRIAVGPEYRSMLRGSRFSSFQVLNDVGVPGG